MSAIPTAAYIRVSTQEQKLHGISLDAQRDKLREYADNYNLDIVAWYEDEGVSGRKLIKNRPALQRMIKDSQRGLFTHIIFIKLDRFFRSVAEYHEAMKMLGNVTWTAIEEKYDMTTANGRAFINMKLTIAELEADQTGERIKFTNDYKVKTGQPLSGSMPWSHIIVKTDDGKRIVANPETRDNCVDVIMYYIRCGSLGRTLLYCNKYHSFYDLKGLKSWLSNTMLIGEYRGNSNYCEPIIDTETFNKIQRSLSNNIRAPKIGVPMFSRLLVCPECGRKLNATTYRSVTNGKEYRYEKYRCDNNVKKHGCSMRWALSENMVERCLLDNLERFVDIQSSVDYTIAIERNKKKFGSLKNELDRLNYMFEKGRIDVNAYDSKYDAIQNKMRECSEPNAPDEEKIKRLNSLIQSGWREIYDALDKEHRADFWHQLLKDVTIEKSGRDYWINRIDFN